MAKKEQFEILASQCFIERGMSIAKIAKKYPVSEKTLFAWKKEGDWDKKRERYLKSQYSCNQNLYELLNLVTQKALQDFRETGEIPDQKSLYFIMNMAGKLKDLKAFEQGVVDEKIIDETAENKNQDKQVSTDEIIQKILKAMTN